LAAQFNFAAGVETCQATLDTTVAAEDLLVSIGCDSTGKDLRPKHRSKPWQVIGSEITRFFNEI
jgi:hypothetical protein